MGSSNWIVITAWHTLTTAHSFSKNTGTLPAAGIPTENHFAAVAFLVEVRFHSSLLSSSFPGRHGGLRRISSAIQAVSYYRKIHEMPNVPNTEEVGRIQWTKWIGCRWSSVGLECSEFGCREGYSLSCWLLGFAVAAMVVRCSHENCDSFFFGVSDQVQFIRRGFSTMSTPESGVLHEQALHK